MRDSIPSRASERLPELSLRDHFAAQAIATAAELCHADGAFPSDENIAVTAYGIADAMLQARGPLATGPVDTGDGELEADACPDCGDTDRLPGKELCPRCHGEGALLDATCPRCAGEGTLDEQPCPCCHGEGVADEAECPRCRGDGEIDGETCPRCRGDGTVDDLTCARCHGDGTVDEVACPQCQGEGVVDQLECPDCHGIGWVLTEEARRMAELARYALCKQLSTAHTLESNYGGLALDDELRQAIIEALTPILKRRAALAEEVRHDD